MCADGAKKRDRTRGQSATLPQFCKAYNGDQSGLIPTLDSKQTLESLAEFIILNYGHFVHTHTQCTS